LLIGEARLIAVEGAWGGWLPYPIFSAITPSWGLSK
jgi:hypothetical protein